MGWMCLEIPTLLSQQQVSLHCLTPCSSLPSSLGLRSPPFAGHCIALNCYLPTIVIKSSLLECQSFSSGFLHARVCLFGGLRSRHLLLTQEILNCTASCQLVFLTWWLLMQAQADGHLCSSLDIPFTSLSKSHWSKLWGHPVLVCNSSINCLLQFALSTEELEQSLGEKQPVMFLKGQPA